MEASMDGEVKVFKKSAYSMTPFLLDGKKIDRAFEVSLSEFASKTDLGCGLFRMKQNEFDLTYPNDEVMLIVEGQVDFGIGKEELHLEKGDIIQVREGFHARIRTRDEVVIFFASYPVASVRKQAPK
jgi:ethanolamine utilization protein EutQ (cupin superfamily)